MYDRGSSGLRSSYGLWGCGWLRSRSRLRLDRCCENTLERALCFSGNACVRRHLKFLCRIRRLVFIPESDFGAFVIDCLYQISVGVREVERACQTNAPETAIYLQSDRSWATVDGIENEKMRARVEQLAEQLEQGEEVNGI